VQVTVKNGKVYEGVLRTTSPKVFIISDVWYIVPLIDRYACGVL